METASNWKVMWKEVRHDKLALCGLVLFVALVLTVYIWAFFIDEAQAIRLNLSNMNRAPSARHIMGTDPLGRDMLTQLVLSSRNSLNISFIVTIAGSGIGMFLGLVMGYYGKFVDFAMMRVIALWGMIPNLMLIMLFRTMFNPDVLGFSLIMIIVGGWGGMAMMMRIMTFRQGALDYVAASKTLGSPNIMIIFREVLPNLVSIISSYLTILLAGNMGLETGLTFLGFGLPPGTPSLGTLIAYARNPATMQNRPWQWLPAALLIFILMLCINFVGQALNRAADAKKRKV
ncbi:MAG: ABC transporter permease [Treponema sp.]|nr:ABC transporter permease [Treponema sp.]